MSAAEMREALKPCPFCGGADIRRDDHGFPVSFACEDCGARGGASEESLSEAADFWNRRAPLPDEGGMVESRASPENTWSGIRAGLTYEQNALLRAYGAPTYEERERALDQIARDIAERVARLEARAVIRAINGGEP